MLLAISFLLFGITIIISSTLPGMGLGEKIEVPRLVSILSGGFSIYGGYVIWEELS
jgi:hypothetical protein